jgi:periplasmic mercuric ion binding protein
MKIITLCLFMLTAFSFPGLTQQKAVQKAVIQTPGVLCEACKTKIENRLVHEDGISSVKADYRKHTVTVVWLTDRTNIENIKTELANLGFDADDVTAEQDAIKRLPPCCRTAVPVKGSADSK